MTSLPYEIQENVSKKRSSDPRPFLHNNFSEVDYIDDVNEIVLKIDSNDRNIDKYIDPFSFRVRFNQTESNYDAYGNAGPIILSKYDNIKYIRLVEAIIPRRNIVQEYVNYNKTLYKNSKIHCYSLLEIKNGTKKLKLKLNSGDQIKISATNYTVERHITYNNVDYLQLKDEFYTAGAAQLYYQNVKLVGTVSGTKGQTSISGINTEFTKLFTNYKIKVNNQELIINTITNDLELIVTTALTESFSNADIYVIYDLNSKAKDTAGANVNGKAGSTSNVINFQQDTHINDDTITSINDVVLFNKPNGDLGGDKIKESSLDTSSKITLYSPLDEPINDQKFLVLPKTNFDKMPGKIHFDKTNKTITGININFKEYQVGSIIHLANLTDSTVDTDAAVTYGSTNIPVDNSVLPYFPIGSIVYLSDGTIVGKVTSLLDSGGASTLTIGDGVKTTAINGATSLYKEDKYVILKVTQIVSESEIKVEIIKDGDTTHALNNKTTGTNALDIMVQEIYNYSYVRSEEEFSDERFILTNIKEFGNNTFEGTNENASKAFGILFPAGSTEGQAYMSGLSYKLYNRRNLQNLNSLTISFNDSYGNKLKLNHLDSSVDRDNIRHPLNKDNQVHLTFRIGVVENRFD